MSCRAVHLRSRSLNIVSLSDLIEDSYRSWDLYTTGQLVHGQQQKKNRFPLNGNGIMSSFLGWQFYRSTLYIYIYIYIYWVRDLISGVILWTPSHGRTYLQQHDVALKTYRERWMIGTSGGRGSGKSMLAAHHDDDDIYFENIWFTKEFFWNKIFKLARVHLFVNSRTLPSIGI